MTSLPHDEPGTGRRAPRYGDFPGLFQDADPDAEIDAENPVALSRILDSNQLDIIASLLTPVQLRRRLKDLPLPQHRREFWDMVVERVENARGD